MSLDYDLSKIENWQEVCFEEVNDYPGSPGVVRMRKPIVDAILFGSMSVGMGRITHDNWREFYARLSIYEEVHGAFLVGADGDSPVSWQTVRQFVGLRTNVSSMSRAQWLRTVMGRALDERIRQVEIKEKGE